MNCLRRCSMYMVPFAFMLIAGVCLLGWTLFPASMRWFILPAVFFMMLLVDFVNSGRAHPARKQAFGQTQFALRLFITAVALVVAASILFRLAIATELLEPAWLLPVRRIAGLASSMALIVFGNYLPKLPSPWRLAEEPFDWQGVHRFAGMALMFAGCAGFASWALMPVADARVLSGAAFLAMAVVVVGRKWYSVLTWPQKRERFLHD